LKRPPGPWKIPRQATIVVWGGTKAKNLVYDGGVDRTLLLSTDLAKVPRGSVVRVFNITNALGTDITVKVGSTTLSVVGLNKMSEFLFYVDGSTAKWLLVQGNVTSGRV
jgi:hypothetical protein